MEKARYGFAFLAIADCFFLGLSGFSLRTNESPRFSSAVRSVPFNLAPILLSAYARFVMHVGSASSNSVIMWYESRYPAANEKRFLPRQAADVTSAVV